MRDKQVSGFSFFKANELSLLKNVFVWTVVKWSMMGLQMDQAHTRQRTW